MLGQPQKPDGPGGPWNPAVGDEPSQHAGNLQVQSASAGVIVGTRPVMIQMRREQHFLPGLRRTGNNAAHDLGVTLERTGLDARAQAHGAS